MGLNTDDLGAIDVAALMAQMRLEVPQGTVTVQGIVAEARPWSKDQTIVFGELQGFDGSTMSFKCPVSAGLRKEDHPVLRGTLNVYKSKRHRGFDLLLEGTRVGAWTPSEPPALHQTPLERTGPKLTLHRFLFQKNIEDLVLIGTGTGITDAKEALGPGSVQFIQTRLTSTSLEALLRVIAEASNNKDCAGLCLLRGGGDPNSFSTWNDNRLMEALIGTGKPFYTALGHTHDLTLADKHADESFATPSILGKTCNDGLQEKARWQRMELSLDAEKKKVRAISGRMNGSDLDRRMLQLQTSFDEFRKLPAVLGKQTGQAVAFAIKALIQDEFKLPVSEAIHGPIANLNQVTEQARVVLAKTIKELRLHAWTWLLFVFVLGVFAGAYGLYSLERSALFGTRHEATSAQQPSPPSTKPSELRPGSGRRGH